MIDGSAPPPVLDGSFVPAPVPGVVAVAAGAEAVLVDEVTDQLHLLNATAALIWACFDGEASVADICFDLADGLDVPFEQALGDTLDVVRALVAEGVVFDGRLGPPRRAPQGLLDGVAPEGHLGDGGPDEEGVPAGHRRPPLLVEPPNT